MRVKLEEVFAVLPMLDENNLDDVLQTMEATEADIEAMSDVNALSKFLALSSVSVAMESTKLWHDVFFDERNALSGLCGEPEWMTPLFLPFLISADMIGALVMPLWLPTFSPALIDCSQLLGFWFCVVNIPFWVLIVLHVVFAPPIFTSCKACIVIYELFSWLE